jgi:hypothetical protein
VLEYLRDKKVHLPITVSKEAVLSELDFYGVDNVDEEAIEESSTTQDMVQAAQSSCWKILPNGLIQPFKAATHCLKLFGMPLASDVRDCSKIVSIGFIRGWKVAVIVLESSCAICSEIVEPVVSSIFRAIDITILGGTFWIGFVVGGMEKHHFEKF